jgi:hypothetical protein
VDNVRLRSRQSPFLGSIVLDMAHALKRRSCKSEQRLADDMDRNLRYSPVVTGPQNVRLSKRQPNSTLIRTPAQRNRMM